MKKREKLNLLWLAKKGLMRFRLWFILKLITTILWTFFIVNIFMLIQFKFPVFKNNIYAYLSTYLLILINFLSLLLIIIMTTFTLKLRQNELGLYRCCGATRGELLMLILNESIVLNLFSIGIVVILEILFVYKLRFFIFNYFNLIIDFSFILYMIKAFVFSFFYIFSLLFVSYLPFGIYYAYRDPYNIIRY